MIFLNPFSLLSGPATKTALTKVVNDLLLTDSTSVLWLLDPSAAFDPIDHCILIDRLENNLGVSGLALAWLKSYLIERTQCVSFNNVTSVFSDVKYGVPQDSALDFFRGVCGYKIPRYKRLCTSENTAKIFNRACFLGFKQHLRT